MQNIGQHAFGQMSFYRMADPGDGLAGFGTSGPQVAAPASLAEEAATQEKLLLRGCQLGLVIGGAALIALGCGAAAAWTRPFAALAIGGALAGLAYHDRRRRRGAGEGPVALAMPIAGLVSGVFALLIQP
jgi:hypothetical protein